MTRRSYDQFCGLSRALDVVGERWTLLIVRELMSGPKRYSDLTETLIGIGTSLLANRLKQLDADGIVARRYLGPPIASTVYELTDVGQELANAMVPLAVWGARHQVVGGPAETDSYHPEWTLLFVARLMPPTELTEDHTYDVWIGDDSARLTIVDHSASVTVGEVSTPADAVLRTDAATIAALVGGRAVVADVVADGRMRVDGDPAALEFLLRVLDGVQQSVVASV